MKVREGAWSRGVCIDGAGQLRVSVGGQMHGGRAGCRRMHARRAGVDI